MDNNGIDPGLFAQNHVAREIPRDLVVAHGVAAILDDDDGVVVAQHMRKRLHQDRGLLLRLRLRLFVRARILFVHRLLPRGHPVRVLAARRDKLNAGDAEGGAGENGAAGERYLRISADI